MKMMILSQISLLVTLALNRLDAHVTRKHCAGFRFIPAAWRISRIIIQHIDTLPKYGKKNSRCT